MRIRPVLLLPSALLVLLTGCTSASPDVATSSPASASPVAGTASPETASLDPSSSPVSSGSSVPGSSSSPGGSSARGTLVLMPDGLGLLSSGTPVRRLRFGRATATEVDALITATLGAPARQTLSECGQGPRVSSTHNRFSVLYDGTRFVGWTEPGAPGRHLTSVAGLGIGSTLSEVRSAQAAVKTMSESLGPEFFAEGGISGMLDGLKAGSKVTLVYAGETCFFR